MGLPMRGVMSALRALNGVGSVTRGHPRGAMRLPCIEVKQTGQRALRSYDDSAYIVRYELTVNMYAERMSELDALSDEAVAAFTGMGFTVIGVIEQSGEAVCQKTVRLVYED